jgi:hypothetical protein
MREDKGKRLTLRLDDCSEYSSSSCLLLARAERGNVVRCLDCRSYLSASESNHVSIHEQSKRLESCRHMCVL